LSIESTAQFMEVMNLDSHIIALDEGSVVEGEENIKDEEKCAVDIRFEFLIQEDKGCASVQDDMADKVVNDACLRMMYSMAIVR
jgi:hypothetical protein